MMVPGEQDLHGAHGRQARSVDAPDPVQADDQLCLGRMVRWLARTNRRFNRRRTAVDRSKPGLSAHVARTDGNDLPFAQPRPARCARPGAYRSSTKPWAAKS